MSKGLFANTGKALNKDNIELYTPKFVVDKIIPYLDKNKVIGCPFDLESSNFVRYLREKGFKVIYSHILLGQDFLTYEPKEHGDIILSNPPFKNKMKGVKRAMSFNKPFAFILPLMGMNDMNGNDIYKDNEKYGKILVFKQRFSYDGTIKTASFKSALFAYNLIESKYQLIDTRLEPKQETLLMKKEVEKLKESE